MSHFTKSSRSAEDVTYNDLKAVVGHVIAQGRVDIQGVYAGGKSYLSLTGIAAGHWQMARVALVEQR